VTDRLHTKNRGLRWLACIPMVLLCTGCGAQTDNAGSDGMFSFFKNKGASKTVTTVHPDVAAPLVPQAKFTTAQPAATLECTPKQLALDGLPPQGKFLAAPVPGQTKTAFVVEGSAGQPRLTFANVERPGGDLRFEVWELGGSASQPTFARQRALQLDPKQASWSIFYLADVACLPGNRFLLAVGYHAPHAKHGLFVYDSASNSSTKLADVQPYADNLDQLFDSQFVAPDAVIVHYFTDTIRLAADVYYNTPSRLRLFAPRYPQGVELLQLSAADGSVRRWSVIDKTLWIDALDYREKHKPKQLYWSLNLEHVLPR
jgi:hypothetical protein